MSFAFPTKTRSQRRKVSLQSTLHVVPIVAMSCLCAAEAGVAHAQSWSASRTRPLLRQLVSVDGTGESVWPYGGEDLAGDGLQNFADDEAGTDLRTVYADADDRRVWLRAYLAGDESPTAGLTVYFFADTDDRDQTGGPAFGAPLSPGFTMDPTPGGYERAVGVRGDGTLLGVWNWESKSDSWKALNPRKDEVIVELGRDEDPIRIGLRAHGYVQVDLVHELSGLDASCTGNLFVRTWQDAAPARTFGDDDREAFACRPTTDAYGDPSVIRSVECKSDQDCTNDGRCRDEVCLFAAACEGNLDCRSDERCEGGSCIKVVETTCTDSSSCRGLICESGACVACAETGARACANGFDCSPDGRCVDANDFVPGSVSDGGVGTADAGVVRGGAFHCAARSVTQSNLGAFWWGLLALGYLARRSRREGSA